MAAKLVISAIAMATVGNNRGTITGCGADGRMRHKSWDGKQWLPSQTGWDNLGAPANGGSFKWAPATIPVLPANTGETPGKLAMAGVGDDAQAVVREGTGNAWGNWTNLGGSFATPVTMCSWNQPAQPAVPAVALAGTGTDTALWMKANTGSGWGNARWESLGGTFWSAPAMSAYAPSQLAVGGVGIDRQLWMKNRSGNSWSGWTNLGGSFISVVIVISRAPGYMNVYGIGNDKQMWTREYSNSDGWGAWQAMGGSFSSAPAVVAPNQDRIHCFGRGTDGNMHHKRWTRTGGWNTWENMGGSCKSAPAAGSWDSNQVAVGCIANDGSTKFKSDNGTGWVPAGTGWDDMGGNMMDGNW